MALPYRVTITYTHRDHFPSQVRPSGSDLHIQGDIWSNSFDKGPYVGSFTDVVVSNVNSGFKLALPEVRSPRAYRAFYGSYLNDKKAVDCDYKDVKDPFHYEDGRSRRWYVKQSHLIFYMASTRLTDAIYPIQFLRIPTTGQRGLNFNWTVRYDIYAESIWRINIIVLSGKYEVDYPPEGYKKEVEAIIRVGDILFDSFTPIKVERKFSSRFGKKYTIRSKVAVLLAANTEGNLHEIAEVSDVDGITTRWNCPGLEDLYVDPHGDPGFWTLVGHRCSDGLSVDYTMMDINDRGTSLFEVRTTSGTPCPVSLAQELNRDYLIERKFNSTREVIIKTTSDPVGNEERRPISDYIGQKMFAPMFSRDILGESVYIPVGASEAVTTIAEEERRDARRNLTLRYGSALTPSKE